MNEDKRTQHIMRFIAAHKEKVAPEYVESSEGLVVKNKIKAASLRKTLKESRSLVIVKRKFILSKMIG